MAPDPERSWAGVMSTRFLIFSPRPGQFVLLLSFAFLASLSSAQGATSGNPAKPGVTAVREPTAAESQEKISALRAEIARHDIRYHRDAAPEIGDAEYDQLRRKLAELERAFPAAAQAAPPLGAIGDDRTGRFPTYRHRERMLSLEKAYTAAEVRAFYARLTKALGRADLACVVEPKFDGLAISVTYERGQLVRAVTRGNGAEGEDITANARRIANLPGSFSRAEAQDSSHPIPERVELRGEIYFAPADFGRLNAEREAAGEPHFANARALAAGTMRLFDLQEVTRRGPRVVFYGAAATESDAALPPTQRELHVRIKAWGLPGLEECWVAQDADELVRAIDALQRARESFAFPTDGAVVKLDSIALQREAGAGESAPRWAVAYKFAPQRAETQLRAITIQVGRTGVLTPVAELVPVKLGGTTVARATLHNREEIARKDIRPGDSVYVERAGDIIPAIVGVNLARRPVDTAAYVFPARCPECAVAVSQGAEAVVRCLNRSCPAQLRRRLAHFASKACLDLDGVGPAIIDCLVAKGLVKNVADLYRLRREDLLLLGQNVSRSADAVLAAIDASRRAELWRFIAGLGIPQVGGASARDLAREFGSLEALAAATPAEAAGRQMQRPGAGGEAAVRALTAFFAEAENRALVTDLLAAGVRPTSPTVALRPPLTGKTIALTGTLETFTRAQAAAQIEDAGGKVTSTVSRNTHFVVAGADAGAKLEQARALGVEVIDEAELRRLLAEK